MAPGQFLAWSWQAYGHGQWAMGMATGKEAKKGDSARNGRETSRESLAFLLYFFLALLAGTNLTWAHLLVFFPAVTTDEGSGKLPPPELMPSFKLNFFFFSLVNYLFRHSFFG